MRHGWGPGKQDTEPLPLSQEATLINSTGVGHLTISLPHSLPVLPASWGASAIRGGPRSQEGSSGKPGLSWVQGGHCPGCATSQTLVVHVLHDLGLSLGSHAPW